MSSGQHSALSDCKHGFSCCNISRSKFCSFLIQSGHYSLFHIWVKCILTFCAWNMSNEKNNKLKMTRIIIENLSPSLAPVVKPSLLSTSSDSVFSSTSGLLESILNILDSVPSTSSSPTSVQTKFWRLNFEVIQICYWVDGGWFSWNASSIRTLHTSFSDMIHCMLGTFLAFG